MFNKTANKITRKIGFLGGGHLGRALITGLLNAAEAPIASSNIVASTRSEESAAFLTKEFAIDARCHNKWLVATSNCILLAVKPQQMEEVLREISACDLTDKIIISVAAGIRLEHYRRILGDEVTIIRAMPTIAAGYQLSLTALYSDDDLNDEDFEFVDNLLERLGMNFWLADETQLDAITALSGSGIAYFFKLMQAMALRGESYGFCRDELMQIISFTAMAAGVMASEQKITENNEDNFGDLCRQIAVPGGTTAKALEVFNNADFDGIVAAAMDSVVVKSKQLGDNLAKDW